MTITATEKFNPANVIPDAVVLRLTWADGASDLYAVPREEVPEADALKHAAAGNWVGIKFKSLHGVACWCIAQLQAA